MFWTVFFTVLGVVVIATIHGIVMGIFVGKQIAKSEDKILSQLGWPAKTGFSEAGRKVVFDKHGRICCSNCGEHHQGSCKDSQS